MSDNGDFSNDNAPVHETNAAALRESREGAEAVVKAAAGLDSGLAAAAVPVEQRRVWRSFVSPLFQDAKFLVVKGKVQSFPDMNSQFGSRDIQRIGDKWATFGGGVLTTNDPEIIDWCLRHDGFHDDPETGARLPGICVDANDKRAAAWSNMKTGQQNLAAREPSIDPSFDVDEMIYPEKAAAAGTEADVRSGRDQYLGAQMGGLVQAARDNEDAANQAEERAQRARESATTAPLR